MNPQELQSGDRLRIFENIICSDLRELTGSVENYGPMEDLIYFMVDSSLKIDMNDSGLRLIPGNEGRGWEKI